MSLAWALDRRSILKLGLVGACAALRDVVRVRRASAQGAPAIDQRERHLTNLRQLTFGGQNAEAYFDRAGTRLVFQSTRPPFGCDQIFPMRDDGSEARLVSTGRGRTTCAFFTPDGRKLIYASTHLGGDACPAPPDRSSGYVWPIYPTYDIFAADADGGHLTRLTDNDGYDAEGAIGPDGRIVFTSLRQGDLDLYTMDADGRNVRRLTDEPGYDGGAPERPAHRVRVEPARPGRAVLRAVPRQRGRLGPRADHVRGDVRLVSHVLARWTPARLLVEPGCGVPA